MNHNATLVCWLTVACASFTFSSSSARAEGDCSTHLFVTEEFEPAREDIGSSARDALLVAFRSKSVEAGLDPSSEEAISAALEFQGLAQAPPDEQLAAAQAEVGLTIAVMAMLRCSESGCVVKMSAGEESKPAYLKFEQGGSLTRKGEADMLALLERAARQKGCAPADEPTDEPALDTSEDESLPPPTETEAIEEPPVQPVSSAMYIEKAGTVAIASSLVESAQIMSDLEATYKAELAALEQESQQLDSAVVSASSNDSWASRDHFVIGVAYQRLIGFTGGHGIEFMLGSINGRFGGFHAGFATGVLPETTDGYLSLRAGFDVSLVNMQWFQLGVRSSAVLYALPIVVPDLQGEAFFRAGVLYGSISGLIFNPSGAFNVGLSIAL